MKRVKYYSSDNRLIFKGSWSLRLVPELYSQRPVLTGQSRLPCGPLGGRRSRHSGSHLVLAAACAILTRSLPLSPCFLPFLEALDGDFQSWLALCSETPTEWVQSSRVALPFHEITSISMQSCERALLFCCRSVTMATTKDIQGQPMKKTTAHPSKRWSPPVSQGKKPDSFRSLSLPAEIKNKERKKRNRRRLHTNPEIVT